jgi:hypothetical protein
VGVLGAPLADGQPLLGVDLGPTHIRERGLAKRLVSCGVCPVCERCTCSGRGPMDMVSNSMPCVLAAGVSKYLRKCSDVNKRQSQVDDDASSQAKDDWRVVDLGDLDFPRFKDKDILVKAKQGSAKRADLVGYANKVSPPLD